MSELKYEPLFGRVLLQREIVEKTAGGIIIANAKKHSKLDGTIVALGPTADESLKVGQKVIFGRHAGAWLDSSFSNNQENDDGTLFICQDEDILAIVKGA